MKERPKKCVKCGDEKSFGFEDAEKRIDTCGPCTILEAITLGWFEQEGIKNG